MYNLITEVKKMKEMMGLITEDQDSDSINKHAKNILNILKFSGLYSSTIKKSIYQSTTEENRCVITLIGTQYFYLEIN